VTEEVKKEEPKKKGILGKIKEATDDKEEQLAILSTFVRLGILVWSGGILTLAYIKLPPALGIPEQKLDPTLSHQCSPEFLQLLVSRLLRRMATELSKPKVQSQRLTWRNSLRRLLQQHQHKSFASNKLQSSLSPLTVANPL